MRLAINGFGRIGRCLLRAASLRSDCADLAFVALNEQASPEAIAYLTQYDSTHGRFPGSVELRNLESSKKIDGRQLCVASDAVSHSLTILNSGGAPDWASAGVDLLVECTGQYGTELLAQQHIDSGAPQVLLSYPGHSTIPATVCGVNDDQLEPAAKILSAASCTSNALLPVVDVLHRSFGVEAGVVTTLHAAMNDQPVIDAYHSDDLRKNRAASESMIPVHTELAQGVGRILPELAGKFIAHAVRVPITDVSALNVSLTLQASVSTAQVNQVLSEASVNCMKGIIGYSQEALASCDFVSDPRSAVIDALQTQVVNDRTVNLLIWFDNEWAFVNRMLDIILRVAKSDGAIN